MASKKVIVIGGSAGSLPVLMQLLQALPSNFSLPVIVVLHRQRNVVSEMKKILGKVHAHKEIIEPDDKEPVNDCCIYLAPQNYHLLIEQDLTFSLDYSEVVKYSRPSIDVTFESAAMVYGQGVTAILLSGANNDGSRGLQVVIEKGGIGIVQDPSTAEYTAMPRAAIEAEGAVRVLKPEEISLFLHSLQY